MTRLILASTSPARRQLLERLGLGFEALAPNVNETAREGEQASHLAMRLAKAKAEAITNLEAASDIIVIGADQVAELDGLLLRKPGDHATALRQLMDCQGKAVVFHTATTVLAPAADRHWQGLDRTRVEFRELEESQLRRYIEREQPYDCTGGFKAEGLGITLFAAIESQDPTALIGLPLIWLTGVLRNLGLDPLR